MSNLVAAKLRACEDIIERGQQTFIEVGRALARIRDERLFREAGFASFDTYCRDRWGMQKSYASRLIAGSEVAQEFPMGNQRQAYELSRVPEAQRAEVMERVVERVAQEKRPVTAALIREVATENEPHLRCQHCEIHCPVRYTRKER